jgi:hypothetical protein
MKNTRIMMAVCSIILVALACSFSATTANIKDAWTASDEAGNNRTTVFSQNDIFYVKVVLANAPDDTKVKASFTAVDAEGEQPNTFIDDYELTSGDGTLTFNLTNNGAWPKGKYKVDLYINDKLDRTIDFEVQ